MDKFRKYLILTIIFSLFLVVFPKNTQGFWAASNCYSIESNCDANCNTYCTYLGADKGYCYSGYSNCGLVSERRMCWCWKEAGSDCKTACSAYAAYYCSNSANWHSVFNEPTGICSGPNRWHAYEMGTKSECGGQYCYCFNFVPDSNCALTVTNSTGASNITSSSARLNGEVTGTGGENPTVRIFWGDNDGGINGSNWDTNVDLGIKGLTTFSQDIAMLSPSTTYYYRTYATNSGGSDWADSTASFSTSAPPNQAPTISSVSDSPDPVTAGNSITFTVNWSDPNSGDQTKIHLCKSNVISGQICSGGSWCDTVSWSVTSPTPCSYTTITEDLGTKNYYAFVCDDDNVCSSSTSGTFIVQAVITVPTVTNSTGASNITFNSARLNGEVAATGGDNPTVSFYWGTTDGGTTPANWANQAVAPDSPAQPMGTGTFYKDISGLSASNVYYYRSRATNSAGSSWGSTTASFTTAAIPIPAAPANLTGTAFCADSNNPDISLIWTDNSNNETGFKLYQGATAGFTPADPPLASLAASVTSYTDTTPLASTTYYYKIKAYNGGGDSAYASSPAITTDSCVPTFVLTPSSAAISVGGSQQFDGHYDSDGPGGGAASSIVTRTLVTWSSSNASIATINTSGLASGVSVGSLTINGVYSGITATAALTVSAAVTGVWQSCEAGTLYCNIGWDYSMGYKFTPNSNGQITNLCGYFSGTKTVKLYNSSYSVLASVSVASSNNWSCYSIGPVSVISGSIYYVVAEMASSGACYRYSAGLPKTCGSITINTGVYQFPSGTFNASHFEYAGDMYGMADIVFSATATYNLSISKTGTGTGTVSSSPAGINCGSTCSASYASGTSVTLTAAPDAGSIFAGWSGDCSGTGTCTLTMSAAKSATATFNLAVSGGCSGTAVYQTPLNATASSIYNSSYPASNAIDGNVSTGWYSQYNSPPRWIYFDLGNGKCISGVNSIFNTYGYPLTMNIQILNDASAWTTLVSGWSVTDSYQWKEKLFSETHARYLRLYETAFQYYGNCNEIQIKTRNYSP